MNLRDFNSISCEIAAVEEMIKQIPPEKVIELLSLTSRKQELEEEIRNDPVQKQVFIIHPVRNITEEMREKIQVYVQKLEAQGIKVYDPMRDTDQTDIVGLNICTSNLRAIEDADEVHIAWDGISSGCLFDFGMSFALGKKINIIKELFPPEEKGHKAFANMLRAYEEQRSKFSS
jgi:hypothetical protein